MHSSTLDAIVALDVLCLQDPDGGPLNVAAQRKRLEAVTLQARFALVRRNGTLVGYGYMWPLVDDTWFVGGLAIHPDYRNAGVTAELVRSFSAMVESSRAVILESHVLADNLASVRLHRRLGFIPFHRDERAIAFRACVADLKLFQLPSSGGGRSHMTMAASLGQYA